ncbi:LacI family DNA-binding transcriptional regulator [Corynebacterium sp.]|uniref:LacI family DNA-binding transcriptional regulator n=1 Tax=Corynebacterium sp. TaxID=1720 RepID=UPI0026E04DBF|nr:LacI family DNA-binding transcriptional regulator [Corynebacterium sp.]MDO5511766.1 LacI family DNA-binding transcriptional regulator [Corynebacterium sp.]
MARPTLKDVAAAAGVSVSTASRALAGNPAIASATTARVRACAADLNYQPNAQARALRSSRTNIIGLTVPSLANPFFATMAHVIQQEASRHGLSTIISSTAEDPDQLATSLGTLAAQQVDGILAVPYNGSAAAFTRLGMPVVLVDRELPDAHLPTVASDPRPGIDAAVAHLLERGHRHLGYLSGPMTTSTGVGRLAAFEEACGRHGVDKQEIYHGGYDRSDGYDGTLDLLDRGVEAIIAGDSMMSVGALEACHARRIAIGSELAFIGFDDNPTMRLQAIPITVVDQHVADLATRALHLLIGLMSGTSPPTPPTIPTTLIIRPSSDFTRRR